MTVLTLSKASKAIEKIIQAKLVPFMVGSPGCGKSDVVKQVAKKHKLKVIDLRLSQCDPTDLGGFPTITGNKADYVPMDHFPISTDTVPEGYQGWLLFLDEFSSAPPSIQAAAYKLVLDRMVGSHHLHERVAVVAAGNKATDNAIVEDMSTALQSRLVHLEVDVNKDEWLEWAANAGVDYRIQSFIEFRPESLYTFDPNHSDKTYACPRTWGFANALLKSFDEDFDSVFDATMEGTLGKGVALEFITFLQIHRSLPTLKEILAKPEEVIINTSDPSIVFALSGMVAFNFDEANEEVLGKFIKRLPAEFQFMTVKQILRKDKKYLRTPFVMDWMQSNKNRFFK